jgi:uncharacterized membrane protein YdjX (TVP38/TMEM64 family)
VTNLTPRPLQDEPRSPEGDNQPILSRQPGAASRWLVLAIIVIAIGAFYALGLHRHLSWESVRANIHSWQASARENLLLSLGVFFAVYVAVATLSLPVAGMLSLVAGALFGLALGVPLVSISATLGATGAFLLARYLLRDAVQRRFGDRLAAINRGVERDGAYYLFTLRLTPAVPFFLINLGMALTPMRATTFALISWVGMLPASFVFINAGTELGKVETPSDILSPGVILALVLLGMLPLVLRLLVRRFGRTQESTRSL